jgi:hypothetical protein
MGPAGSGERLGPDSPGGGALRFGGIARRLQAVLLKIRSFYLDLQSWAYEDPDLWAHWVAPCPVREADVRRVRRDQSR